MRPTTLIPGRQYHSAGIFGAPKTYTFVRRDRQPCRPAINIFQCDDYRGMNGPNDAGITHLTDYQVRINITPKPEASR